MDKESFERLSQENPELLEPEQWLERQKNTRPKEDGREADAAETEKSAINSIYNYITTLESRQAIPAAEILGDAVRKAYTYLTETEQASVYTQLRAIAKKSSCALEFDKIFRAFEKDNKKSRKKLSKKQLFDSDIPDFVVLEPMPDGRIRKSISPPKLAQHIRENEHYMFVRDTAMAGVNRFWYSGGYFHLVADDEVRGHIKRYVDEYDPTLLKMRDIDETLRILYSDLVFHSFSELNADENLICFKDCILDIRDFKTYPHSPKYLITRQIPICWDSPDRDKDPAIFHKYMAHLCTGDENFEKMHADSTGGETYAVLMQYLGACISNIKGWRFKKSLFMYGLGDSGKSQLKALAEYLIGMENICSCDLSQLEQRFGASTIFNKRLIGSSDMSFMTIMELNIFKRLTGGDTIHTEFKGTNGFDFIFEGLSWFCMNRLPRFGGDNGQWVYDRIIPVPCNYVVPEDKRDPKLLEKMKAEAPAIVKESLIHLQSALKSGSPRFTEPKITAEIRKQYDIDNNSIAAWVNECCIIVDNPGSEWVTVEQWRSDHDAPSVRTLYNMYRSWCDQTKEHSAKYKDFVDAITQKYGGLEEKKRRSGYVFGGICLNDEHRPEAISFTVSALRSTSPGHDSNPVSRQFSKW